MKSKFKRLLLSAAIAFTSVNSLADEQTLDKAEIKKVTESISQLMKSDYVFPEQAEKMAKLLSEKTSAGKYDHFVKPQAFSEQLTEDLRSINHDLHIRVRFDPQRIKQRRAAENLPAEQQVNDDAMRRMQQANFGFKEVKILDGNIGYINLTNFTDTQFGGETAVAAMNMVANTDALIFDLRENGGGSPSMIQLITSYLYNSEPVHLNNFYWRPSDLNTQTWTLPHVQGKRNPDVDVYVLTSQRTFSAAEEFSYNLKNLERATLVGETTGGGAHPGGTSIATDRFMVWVPRGRAINPITNTNWEGTGVTPDIKVKKEQALDVAHIKALEKLVAKNSDHNFSYQWHLDGLQAKNKTINISDKTLASYAGDYDNRILSVIDGELYYQRKGQDKRKLQALATDLFMLPGVKYFRLKIVKENGEVVAVKGLYDNGRIDESIKKS